MFLTNFRFILISLFYCSYFLKLYHPSHKKTNTYDSGLKFANQIAVEV